MFLIDDILLSPFNGLIYIFRELHKAVQQDSVNVKESIRTEMSELYMQLETGQITEDEADAREKELLDRLEAIERRESRSQDDEDDEDEDEDDMEEEEDEEDEDEEEDEESLTDEDQPSGEDAGPG